MLRLPPNPTILKSLADQPLPNAAVGIVPSRSLPLNQRMRLGLLPVADPQAPRTANLITGKDLII